jgi:hypothetical protein
MHRYVRSESPESQKFFSEPHPTPTPQRDTLAAMGVPASLAEILAWNHAPRAAAIASARALHNLSIHGGPRSAVVAAGGAAALVSRLRAHVGESADEDGVIVTALNYLSSGGALRAHREAVVAASGANAISMALSRHGHRSAETS